MKKKIAIILQFLPLLINSSENNENIKEQLLEKNDQNSSSDEENTNIVLPNVNQNANLPFLNEQNVNLDDNQILNLNYIEENNDNIGHVNNQNENYIQMEQNDNKQESHYRPIPDIRDKMNARNSNSNQFPLSYITYEDKDLIMNININSQPQGKCSKLRKMMSSLKSRTQNFLKNCKCKHRQHRNQLNAHDNVYDPMKLNDEFKEMMKNPKYVYVITKENTRLIKDYNDSDGFKNVVDPEGKDAIEFVEYNGNKHEEWMIKIPIDDSEMLQNVRRRLTQSRINFREQAQYIRIATQRHNLGDLDQQLQENFNALFEGEEFYDRIGFIMSKVKQGQLHIVLDYKHFERFQESIKNGKMNKDLIFDYIYNCYDFEEFDAALKNMRIIFWSIIPTILIQQTFISGYKLNEYFLNPHVTETELKISFNQAIRFMLFLTPLYSFIQLKLNAPFTMKDIIYKVSKSDTNYIAPAVLQPGFNRQYLCSKVCDFFQFGLLRRAIWTVLDAIEKLYENPTIWGPVVYIGINLCLLFSMAYLSSSLGLFDINDYIAEGNVIIKVIELALGALYSIVHPTFNIGAKYDHPETWLTIQSISKNVFSTTFMVLAFLLMKNMKVGGFQYMRQGQDLYDQPEFRETFLGNVCSGIQSFFKHQSSPTYCVLPSRCCKRRCVCNRGAKAHEYGLISRSCFFSNKALTMILLTMMLFAISKLGRTGAAISELKAIPAFVISWLWTAPLVDIIHSTKRPYMVAVLNVFFLLASCSVGFFDVATNDKNFGKLMPKDWGRIVGVDVFGQYGSWIAEGYFVQSLQVAGLLIAEGARRITRFPRPANHRVVKRVAIGFYVICCILFMLLPLLPLMMKK